MGFGLPVRNHTWFHAVETTKQCYPWPRVIPLYIGIIFSYITIATPYLIILRLWRLQFAGITQLSPNQLDTKVPRYFQHFGGSPLIRTLLK